MTNVQRIYPFVILACALVLIFGIFTLFFVDQRSINQTTRATTKNYALVVSGEGKNNNYSLAELTLESTKPMPILVGYKIVSHHDRQPNPRYLIVEKHNQLFSYDLFKDQFTKIIIDDLKDTEASGASQSISNKNQFFIVIEDQKKLKEPGLLDYEIVSSRKYFFDANTGKVEPATDPELPGGQIFSCYYYDSKNSRFFSWPCGEGVGRALPLSSYDFDKKIETRVIGPEAFGLDKDDLGAIDIDYYDGYFIAVPKNKTDFKQIAVISANKDLSTQTYKVSEKLAQQIDDPYAYSVLFVSKDGLIVIGGANAIHFLKTANGLVESVLRLSAPTGYLNEMFINGEKLYYQKPNDNKLYVVDLKTKKIDGHIDIGGLILTLANL